jgi:hypothetical protein
MPTNEPSFTFTIDQVRTSTVAFWDGVCPTCTHTFEEHAEGGCQHKDCSCDIQVKETR